MDSHRTYICTACTLVASPHIPIASSTLKLIPARFLITISCKHILHFSYPSQFFLTLKWLQDLLWPQSMSRILGTILSPRRQRKTPPEKALSAKLAREQQKTPPLLPQSRTSDMCWGQAHRSCWSYVLTFISLRTSSTYHVLFPFHSGDGAPHLYRVHYTPSIDHFYSEHQTPHLFIRIFEPLGSYIYVSSLFCSEHWTCHLVSHFWASFSLIADDHRWHWSGCL